MRPVLVYVHPILEMDPIFVHTRLSKNVRKHVRMVDPCGHFCQIYRFGT